MKKIIFMLIAGHCTLSATAQNTVPAPFTPDRDLSRWVLDVNLLGGSYNQTMDMAGTSPNYLNGINVNTGNAGFHHGSAFGGDLQVGYFFGKNKHWGIGTGILYLREKGNITLDNFHAVYQSVDNNGYTFRQVVSANPIREEIRIDNFNIPLVLKYKNRFSKHWGFTADAGVLFNLQAKNTYNTNASFDYEAIYKFVTNEGVNTPVYETSVIPADNDFLITKSQFSKNNPGSVEDYFNQKRAAGYNVGLGVKPNQQEGTTSFAKGSVGFILQPSLNYFFSDRVALNVGAYYINQTFKNEATASYTLTGKPGEYSSVVNSVDKVHTQSFGGNLGLRFFLGKKQAGIAISSIDQYAPTACGLCDGSIAIHGLKAGSNAAVTYSLNGGANVNPYLTTVNNEGTITVPELCAGTYSGIKATIGSRSATGNPVTLVAPTLLIDRIASENPSAAGKCDGTVTLYGVHAGQKATISYTVNGARTSNVYTAGADNSIRISGLCDGTITGISVQSNKCVAELTNNDAIVLVAPKPAVVIPVTPVVAVEPAEDNASQILFDFNTATLRPASYVVIDRVLGEMKSDHTTTVFIDGNTDKIGSDEYNQKLSERRAAVVRAYLIKHGISAGRIKDHGNGEREPVASNNTVTGRSKNRRAELVIRMH
jgi:outer membrane protein OmpA-like peptidoglycan-associated protein